MNTIVLNTSALNTSFVLNTSFALAFFQQATDNWVQIATFILILVIAWILLRFVLRLAMRVFSIGCLMIILVAGALAVYRYFS